MPITWKVSPKKDAGTQSIRSPVSWLVLILGAAIAVLGVIGLWTELGVTVRGIPTTARILEHEHRGSAHNDLSTYAQVEVAVPSGRPFRTEVFDQFGVADWVDGGTVDLICVRLATEPPYCGLDSVLDRWLVHATFLVVGLGVVWWGWRRLTRT